MKCLNGRCWGQSGRGGTCRDGFCSISLTDRAQRMTNNQVIIAGGGIGGLATALTLHQIGVPCVVFEAVREMRPLGVGINMQPNAVRELYDLGITQADLDRVGLPAKEWALVGLNGNDIYSEPRGSLAGYNWPQYAVHRGRFHMLLHDKLIERAGPDAVRLGHRVTGYRKNADGSVTALIERADGSASEANGALLIGADGIHSAVRAQMHPTQPPIHWGGAVMWRGTTWGKPIRSGSSFVGLGTHRQRVVFYPISHPDPATGLSMINWIAEVTMDNSEGWKQSGWFRQVEHRRVRAPFRRLGVGLARRAGPDPARRQRVREPDDRPRPDPDLAGRPGGADRRRRAPDVSDRLERRQPGDRRCARAGRLHGRAWRDAGGARGLRQEALRPDLAGGVAQPRRRDRSGCSTWSTSAAAARSTTSRT